MKKRMCTDIIILGAIALILNYFKIRFCPFYNIFKIPCPGCGLTRAFIYLFKFNIKQSLSYNILCIPIIIIVLITLINEDIIKKNKTIFIIISVLLLIITTIININNPKLY